MKIKKMPEVIASIISNNVIKNKTILMVCEKDTALKVILDKYANKGLGRHITHITDTKSISKFRKKLSDDIIEVTNKSIEEVNSNMHSLNKDIQACINELDEINTQLYSKEYGMSLRELYEYRIETVENVNFNINFPSTEFDISQLENIKSDIAIITSNLIKLNGNNLLSKVDDKVNLKSVNIRLDKILKTYEELNKNNAFDIIKTQKAKLGKYQQQVINHYMIHKYNNSKVFLNYHSDPEFERYYLINSNREELDKQILISNIDEIQGDQRDIVIFSIAYGPREHNGDVNGNITGNLNSKDGKFRLNVAISRAKNKIILITSLKSNELPPSDEGEGRSLLKSYLDYCEAIDLNYKENAKQILEKVCSNKNVDKSKKNNNKDESPLETQIREALVSRGGVNQQVDQLGFRIDFAVIDPRDSNRYLLAIEADGATYHSSKSAKERDLYRQQLLERKGWTFIRIWSKDWWKNKEREIERVLNKIKELTD